MIPISYLFEQPQELPPEEQGSLSDRIFARAVQRITDRDMEEEQAVEDEAAQRLDAEKYAAKINARVAEARNSDPELKQLKAAEAIHNKEAAKDAKSLESGLMPQKVARDKEEIAQLNQQKSSQQEASVAEGIINNYI